MKVKILFTELLKLHSDTQVKLKIDNEYIYIKDNHLYFINIDFNCFNFISRGAQSIENSSSRNIYIPDKIYLNNNEILLNTVQISFYCCSFMTEMPPFNDNIKVFYRCNFKNISRNLNTILLKKCNFTNIVNSMHNIEGGEIENLSLLNNSWTTKYYINKQYNGNSRKTNINNLTIKNTVFKENFKLHHCDIKNIIIQDTDFEKHADFFKTIFHKGLTKNKQNNISIYFKAINFKGLALFGDTEFKEKVIFQYITFESFSHFRRSVFHKGLDLDYSNIQQEMNFFGAKRLENKASRENTSQETYRIIKHNFEKIGNKIEANKYHALELDQKRINLSKEKFDSIQRFSEWIVFLFHKVFSNHSSRWYIALFWIFIVGFLTSFSVDNFICPRYECTSSWIDYFKYISIVNLDDCIKKNYLIFLLNKVFLGYLYYQFLISIRKDTKR